MSHVSDSESDKKELAKNKAEAALYSGDGGNIHLPYSVINISSVYNEPSTSGSQTPKTKSETSLLDEGYVRISDDIYMYNKEPLRQGTNIYKGYQKHVDGTRLPMAIKRISPCTDTHVQEVRHLAKLATDPHPNVVRIIQSKERYTDVRTLYIIMELCSSKNLQDYLKEIRAGNIPFDFKKTMSFAKQLVEGIQHIHRLQIIHRDIKPENILLLLDEKHIKIADFGLGKQLRDNRSEATVTAQSQGTVGYQAPETFESDKVSPRGDIFCLGLLLYGLFSNGKHPFGDNIHLLSHNIFSNKGRDLSGLVISGTKKEQLLDLIDKMLQHDQQLRPTIDEVLRHPFFGDGSEMMSSEEMRSHGNVTHITYNITGGVSTVINAPVGQLATGNANITNQGSGNNSVAGSFMAGIVEPFQQSRMPTSRSDSVIVNTVEVAHCGEKELSMPEYAIDKFQRQEIIDSPVTLEVKGQPTTETISDDQEVNNATATPEPAKPPNESQAPQPKDDNMIVIDDDSAVTEIPRLNTPLVSSGTSVAKQPPQMKRSGLYDSAPLKGPKRTRTHLGRPVDSRIPPVQNRPQQVEIADVFDAMRLLPILVISRIGT